MSETGHDLHAEFPADRDALHRLKLENEHFRTLADHYHDVTNDISRIESGLAPASDERLEGLKKQRLSLLDDVAGLIAATKAA
ncbi:YdcH family protein [Sphingobium aquiterrae]|uniref:YdcH family protein n=1 Tax=Sphingobium aquiterrae TaxID=2038656 RepID=UPI003016B493